MKKNKLKNMENNHLVIKKIPLKMFIDVLVDIWNNGADFVDISGCPDSEQDVIDIRVPDEYISRDEDDNIESGFIIEREERNDIDEDYLNGLT